MSRARRRRVEGFTLVELLVVIGIIAVLISLLLPTLNKARAQGQAAKCLSNLRQIGQAMNMYVAEHKGFIVPGAINWWDGGSPQAGRGEENWCTILVSLKYLTATSQLELSNSGTPPAENVYQNYDSFGDSVFRCPSGDNKKGNVGSWSGTATSKTDPANDAFWRRQSMLYWGTGNASQSNGAMIDTWYAGNFVQPNTAADMNNTNPVSGYQAPWPMRCMARNRAGTIGRMFGGPLTRITQIKKSSDMAMIFDGLRSHNYNTNNISLRHGNKRIANFLFADGHAEMVHGDRLPDGMTSADSDLRSVATLVNQPFPLWRLDQ